MRWPFGGTLFGTVAEPRFSTIPRFLVERNGPHRWWVLEKTLFRFGGNSAPEYGYNSIPACPAASNCSSLEEALVFMRWLADGEPPGLVDRLRALGREPYEPYRQHFNDTGEPVPAPAPELDPLDEAQARPSPQGDAA